MIGRQRRTAPSRELDALFGLVWGDAQRYLQLDDPEGDVFRAAFRLASPAMRGWINDTVARSQLEG